MTGADVRSIRTQLGLSVPQLAELIGASQSSIYRWESLGPQEVAIDPGQARLLLLMKQQIDSQNAAALAKGIAAGLLLGGGLLGLYHLLDAVYSDDKKSRRTAPPAQGRARTSPPARRR